MGQEFYVDQNLNDTSRYRQVNFAPLLKSLIARVGDRYQCRTATLDELMSFSAAARRELPNLAPNEILHALYEHRSDIFQIVLDSETGREIGFNAQLPLTEDGLAALLGSNFDPAAPAHNFIAQPSDHIAAVYAWLIYAPRSYVPVVAALADYLDTLTSRGCSIFCRAANDLARKTFNKCGFEDARLSYPGAPDDLLVVHSLAGQPRSELRRIEVRHARSPSDLAMIMAIRGATYMAEQDCPFAEEFDGNDLCGAHLIGYVAGEPAGCIRIRFFGTFVKFERLAVRREFRRSPLAFKLVRAAISYVAQKGFTQVYGHSRKDLQGFWSRFGFRRRLGRAPFVFSDVTYVEMEGTIPAAALPITTDASPYILIRPEGNWGKPGPLERPVNLCRQSEIETLLVNDRSNVKVAHRAMVSPKRASSTAKNR